MDIQHVSTARDLIAELLLPGEPAHLTPAYTLECNAVGSSHRLVIGEELSNNSPKIQESYQVRTLDGLRPCSGAFGRMVSGRYRRELIAEAVRISHSILPLVKAQPGFIAVALCVRPDGENFSLSVWENEILAQATVVSGWWSEQVAKFDSIYLAAPKKSVWSVNIVQGLS